MIVERRAVLKLLAGVPAGGFILHGWQPPRQHALSVKYFSSEGLFYTCTERFAYLREAWPRQSRHVIADPACQLAQLTRAEVWLNGELAETHPIDVTLTGLDSLECTWNWSYS